MHKLFVRFLVVAALLATAGNLHARENTVETAEKPRAGVIRVKLQAEAARMVGKAPRMKAKGAIDAGTAPLTKAAQQVKRLSNKFGQSLFIV